MAMDFNFVFLILSSIIVITFKDVTATDDLEPLANEIREELKELYPSWSETEGYFNFVQISINEVNALKELVAIIDAEITDDKHGKCVKNSNENIKDIIKAATKDFNEAYYIPFYTVFHRYVKSLSSFIQNIGDKEVLTEAIACAGEIAKDEGKGNKVLQCLENLKSTGDTEKVEIKKLWEIYDDILEFDKVKNDILREVTNKISAKVYDLNKIIDDCVEEMNKQETNEHTNESNELYYQEIFTKINDYLQEIKTLGLSAPGRTEFEVKEILSDTSILIVQSVRKINNLKQEIIRQVKEAETEVDNLQECVFGVPKPNSEIFDEHYDGLKKCSDEMEKEQLIFKYTFAKIDNRLDDILKQATTDLIGCKSEDDSAEELAKSFECMQEIDSTYRQDHDSYVQSIVEIATVFNTDALLVCKEAVRKCTEKVVEQGEETEKMFVDKGFKCLENYLNDQLQELENEELEEEEDTEEQESLHTEL